MPRHFRTLALSLAALTCAAVPAVSSAEHRANDAQAQVQSVGSIVAFSGGVLSLEVADGSRVTGAVTDRTRVGCSLGLRGRGHLARLAHRDGRPVGATGPAGPSERGWGSPRHSCDPASLVVGTKVLAADLRLTPDGPAWRLVVFLAPPTAPSGPSGPTGPSGPQTS